MYGVRTYDKLNTSVFKKYMRRNNVYKYFINFKNFLMSYFLWKCHVYDSFMTRFLSKCHILKFIVTKNKIFASKHDVF